jgi:hypothetical protein
MNAVLDASPAEVDMEQEVLVRFGSGGQLTGVLSGPSGTGPTLLLPSAGLQPRAGPFRLHVLLAQRAGGEWHPDLPL